MLYEESRQIQKEFITPAKGIGKMWTRTLKNINSLKQISQKLARTNALKDIL